MLMLISIHSIKMINHLIQINKIQSIYKENDLYQVNNQIFKIKMNQYNYIILFKIIYQKTHQKNIKHKIKSNKKIIINKIEY